MSHKNLANETRGCSAVSGNWRSAGGQEGHPHPLLADTRRQLEAVCNNATLALFIMDERHQCV